MLHVGCESVETILPPEPIAVEEEAAPLLADLLAGLRQELDAIKPVFMLAEWESRDLHEYAFDMTYAWSWYEAILRLVNGQAGVPRPADFGGGPRGTPAGPDVNSMIRRAARRG